VVDGDATAAAAAAAYRIGGNVGGFDAGRPDLTTLDMGACEKFGFGGGFAGRSKSEHNQVDEQGLLTVH
jgi:hypothetical protein